MHGVHDVGRRVDSLDFDADDSHTPLVGGVVEDLAKCGVDPFTGREGLVERHLADDVTEIGLRQLGDGEDEVRDVVEQTLRIGRLEVDDGIDRDGHVVLGDDFLRRNVDHLLAHVDLLQRLDEGEDQTQPRVGGLLVATESFDHPPLIGPHDLDTSGYVDESEQRDDDE